MMLLTLNNVPIDLPDGVDFSVSYSIAKIGEIEKRSGAVSTEINLPKTNGNINFFEYADDVNNASDKPYLEYDARLYVNGVDQNIRYARLDSVNDTYNVRLYGANSAFYSSIKSLKLSDLDLHEFDHFRDFTTIIDSRTNNQGYIYPLIDYHSDSANAYIDNTNRKIDVRGMYPSLFYEDILNASVESFGYTFNNVTPAPHPLLLPYVGDDFVRNMDNERYKGTFSLNTSKSATYNGLGHTAIEFDSVDTNRNYFVLNRTFGRTSVNPNYWIIQDHCNISGTITLRITWAGAPFSCLVNLASSINYLSSTQFSQPITILTGTNDYVLTFSNIETETDPTIIFYISDFSTGSPAFTYEVGTEIKFNSVEIVTATKIEYDITKDYLTCNSIFGDLTLGELFKNYCLSYCKLISVDEKNKVVSLISFSDIANNINAVIDWTDKIDYSEVKELKFSGTDYARINTLTYSDDSNEDKPLGTDGVIELPFMPDDVNEMVELKFSATNTVVRLKDLTINQIAVLKNLAIDYSKRNRVLYLELIQGADLPGSPKHIEYNDGTTANVTTDLPFTWFISPLKQDNLGFGGSKEVISINGLINDYYDLFTQINSKFKMVSLPVRLNEADINKLDFSKPVYIGNDLNAYFYINEIKDYVPGSTSATMVELIKLF